MQPTDISNPDYFHKVVDCADYGVPQHRQRLVLLASKHGPIEMIAPTVKKELYENLSRSNIRVLIDLKNVKRMSTVAVSMIDELSSWLKPWGSTLALCRVRRELQAILPKLSLHNTIPHFPDKRSALAAKW